MEAKDKAIELVHKMYVGFVHNLYSYKAKQCALISVDEIIKAIPCREDYGGDGWVLIDNTEYWQRVKNEIEKL